MPRSASGGDRRGRRRRLALIVDSHDAEQKSVASGSGPGPFSSCLVSGARLLPGGGVAPIVNVAELICTTDTDAAQAISARLKGTAARRRRRLLVADDALTTRTIELSLLKAAGYEVIAAGDGAEAVRFLHETPIVVADVEMPRLTVSS